MKSRIFKTFLVFGLLSVSLLQAQNEKPNVLFIMVDDMNDWVGAFDGHPQAITPNIDKIAKKGVMFKNAYCAAPLCNPSRTSLLTGLRPSTTKVYGNSEHFRDHEGFENVVTLPQHFSANGYQTVASGKIFHSPRGNKPKPKPGSDPGSFQEEKFSKLGTRFPDESFRRSHGIDFTRKDMKGTAKKNFDWYPIEDTKEETNDWQNAEYCAKFLEKEHDKPFFLACGIFRPHLPWYAPKKYFEMYDVDKIELPAYLKDDIKDTGSFGNKMKLGLHDELVSKGLWQEAVRAYLANLTFADDCVGELINALEKSEYKDNTIIVIMGDHGWHLGEKDIWGKNTLWERSAKTPLVIYDPREKGGKASEEVVSLLDVYPTLVEMCGLPANDKNEGSSIIELVKSPKKKLNRTAVTSKDEGMHSIRSNRFRYTIYKDGFEELYDHQNDPNEWTNVAKDKAYQKDLEAMRSAMNAKVTIKTKAQ
ncbi:sulfatase [Flammeovirga sp. MY04]|uniref:sulfatase n=1 Tax=Flammeovirga sp. MY04 TaxID=1191459 RepID=UPI0009FDC6BD|nr:sulfatase [Flammeovirga sp. MY04]ANQ51609.2 sulfatase [Flammeovirga sp. MY04]